MAVFVAKDSAVYVGKLDLSTFLNQGTLDYSVEEVDNTTFQSGTRTAAGGLEVVSLSADGFVDHAEPDAQLHTDVGVADRLVTVCPEDAADNTRAFFFQSLGASLNRSATLGDMYAFSLQASGRGTPLVAGRVLLPKQSVSGIVTGAGRQLGAVSATQKLYTAIHVFTAGTTADVIVESDDNTDFTSATTRSSTTVTAVGGTWVAPVSGAITDDWWRVRTASVTGTFSIAVAVGIV